MCYDFNASLMTIMENSVLVYYASLNFFLTYIPHVCSFTYLFVIVVMEIIKNLAYFVTLPLSLPLSSEEIHQKLLGPKIPSKLAIYPFSL